MKINELFYSKDKYQPKIKGLRTLSEFGGEQRYKLEVDGKIYDFEATELPEDDVVKLWHEVTNEKGRKIFMDWSPYSNPSKEDVILWIKIGMPSRRELGMNGPFERKELVAYAHKKGFPVKRKEMGGSRY